MDADREERARIRRLLDAPFADVVTLRVGERDPGEWYVHVTMRSGRAMGLAVSTQAEAELLLAKMNRWRQEPEPRSSWERSPRLGLVAVVVVVLLGLWLALR